MSWFRPKTLLALLLTGLLFSTGCQNNSSHSGPPAAADPEEAIVIGILLPARGFSELSVWESVAHLQEAPTRSAARVYKMGPTDLPAQQNEQIKQAVTEGCSALIILAADPASIASVVGEVRKAGTPVVILDNPIPNSEGLPAAAFITYEDEVSSVKKLVAAAQAAAKEAGFPADGPAQILSHEWSDGHGKLRQKAFHEVLKAAGIRVLPDVKFNGFKEGASTDLGLAVEIYPHVAMVFADDDDAVRGASEVRQLMDHDQPRFVVAGFVIDPGLLDMMRFNLLAGAVEKNVREPMRIAYDLALALARGETVASETRVPTPFHGKTGVEIDGFFPPYVGRPDLLRKQQVESADLSTQKRTKFNLLGKTP